MNDLYLREPDSKSKNDETIIKNSLKTDFPHRERTPYAVIKKNMLKNIIKIFILTDGSSDFGYIIFQPLKKSRVVYVHYLAVFREQRDKGYGSSLLRLFTAMFPENTVLLEVEDETEIKPAGERNNREKRISFYLNNGFNTVPGVKLNMYGVKMKFMSNRDFKTQDYGKFAKKVYYDLTGSYLATLPIRASYSALS